ncbi:Bsp6I family type II restriction endonuclease [Clostridium sp. B9]|uniref:Bsp6I family type II restriction endonuclease n=1 Tax=Clostridium sp. B9 TaxID=3423224 RepID=UPI003D2F3108
MKTKEIDLLLPEGDFQSQVLEFEPKDITTLKEIYDGWRHLSMNLNKVNARSVNLPEGLSETAFCLAKNMCRVTKSISGANSSFDCYDLNGERHKNRIQVKACSVLPDLTSFGPRSEWDRIFFVDFFREGNWDGTFDVYEIDTDDVNNFYVNSSETVADQKAQNRRPRFSIFNGLILEEKYISKETFKIESDRIIEI